MNQKARRAALIAIGVISAFTFSGCGGSEQDDPRQVVISFFGAMEKNDKATLARVLDLPELMRNTREDYSVATDTPRVFTDPQQILNDLTDSGLTKQRWFSYQRIINNASVQGDAATVEVTFVNKEVGKAYLTKFGLHRVNGRWRIYSFKTFESPGTE